MKNEQVNEEINENDEKDDVGEISEGEPIEE